MTEFQEGRTYLVVCFSDNDTREVKIVTGSYDGNFVVTGAGWQYGAENVVGPLAWIDYYHAGLLIAERNELLHTAEQSVIAAGNITRRLLAQWRELA